jgi:hypothetical protein
VKGRVKVSPRRLHQVSTQKGGKRKYAHNPLLPRSKFGAVACVKPP